MTTVLLVRHGLTALTGPVLAGWTPDVHLDERGRAQADALTIRLEGVRLAAVVTSPLERCLETIGPVAAARSLEPEVDERFGECRYGEWTGRELKALRRDPLWPAVQQHPSGVTFPGGEALREVQGRAVAAVRDWNARLGADATWLACSHADVIKAIVADALGLHLDQFQRIVIDPASLTAIRYATLRPFVARLNDTGGGIAELVTRPRSRGRHASGRTGSPTGSSRTPEASDAPVGGGAGAPPKAGRVGEPR